MGCDIHIHAEVKIKGKWEHYDQPDCDRDYELFERMAGVRGDVKNAIAAPRGIPKNASLMTKFEAKNWGEDGHSHSWISAQEIADLADWEEKRQNPTRLFDRKWDQWLFGNSYSGFIKYPADRVKGIQDVRFIFWFDN
jgi:hypothetical protein